MVDMNFAVTTGLSLSRKREWRVLWPKCPWQSRETLKLFRKFLGVLKAQDIVYTCIEMCLRGTDKQGLTDDGGHSITVEGADRYV